MKHLGTSQWAVTAFAAVIGLSLALPAASQNVLVNPGFESAAAAGNPLIYGAPGWANFGASFTASGPSEPVRSGIGSLRMDSASSFSIPGAYQVFAASEGQTWDLAGYMLTPSALPATATFGLLKMVWSDGTNFLAPGVVNVGQVNNVDFGIESLPFLNASSAPGTWQFAQAQGVAPAGTTLVYMFALFVDESPATVYFDDLAAGVVPEPETAAMLLLGLAAVVGAAARRSPRQAR